MLASPRNTIKISKPKVLDAYFAKKNIQSVEGDETESYVFKGTNSTKTSAQKNNIAGVILNKTKETLASKKKNTTNALIVAALTKDSYSKGDEICFKLAKQKVSFTKLSSGILGQEIYIVITTSDLQNQTVQLNVLQGVEKCLVEKDTVIKVQQNDTELGIIEAKVGDYSTDENILNKDDFKDWAIAQIKIGPKQEATVKKYSAALEKSKDKISKLYLLIDAHSKSGLKVTYNGRNPGKNDAPDLTSTPNHWLDIDGKWFELKDSVLEYSIYSDGKIKKTKVENPSKARFIYIESSGTKHILGTAKTHATQRHTKKNQLSTTKGDDTLLVYAKDVPSYSSGTVKFKFLSWNSSSGRWYINPDCFAGLLGAMIEESIVDLGFNGFSIKDGNTAGGSSSHINGEKGDLRYLSTSENGEATHLQYTTFDYNRQVKFNNALYKYHWGRTGKMYSENFNRTVKKEVTDPVTKEKSIIDVAESTLLPHTKHMKKTTGNSKYRHHHHLHLTGFDFTKITSQ